MLKKFWNWLLGQTTIDEKIVAKVEEVKKTVAVVEARVERVVEEAKDVVEAVKEVKVQAAHVADAATGKPRRGRKPANKKPAASKKTESK